MKALQSHHVALTTDMWTSRATQAYITLTCHWIDDDWNFTNKILFTSEIPERQTGINIAERLKQGCSEWRIPDDHIVFVVHDNASNMTNAVATLSWKSTACVAYTLQLAVTKGLEVSEISRLTSVCRKLVGYFKQCPCFNSTKRKAEAVKHQRALLDPRHFH